jgi:peptide subunit release factor 1 (eRF1)
MLTSRRFQFSRHKMLDFIADLEKRGQSAHTLYIPPGLTTLDVGALLGKFPAAPAIPESAPALAARSGTGAILIWGMEKHYLITPPFPVTEQYFTHGCDVEPLRSLLKCDFKVALVLIRKGAYAIGVWRGEELLNSKVGTGLVHSRHRQGGSSANRFRRHREKQIETFLIRVCRHLQEELLPHARDLNYLVYGGARTTILELEKQCPFLAQFNGRNLPPLLEIADPNRGVLEEAYRRALATTIVEWTENR